jgi:hypothetical protein
MGWLVVGATHRGALQSDLSRSVDHNTNACRLDNCVPRSRESPGGVLREFHIPGWLGATQSHLPHCARPEVLAVLGSLAAVHTPSRCWRSGLRHGLLTPARQALNPPTQDSALRPAVLDRITSITQGTLTEYSHIRWQESLIGQHTVSSLRERTAVRRRPRPGSALPGRYPANLQ